MGVTMEEMKKPKIYLFCTPCGKYGLCAKALAEDGTKLGGHLSSNEKFAKHDIGLTSTWHHDDYQKYYPDGYEVEWVDQKDFETHEGFRQAMKLFKEKTGQ